MGASATVLLLALLLTGNQQQAPSHRQSGAAAESDVVVGMPGGGFRTVRRCATADPDPRTRDAVERQLATAPSPGAPGKGRLKVPVIFHVISSRSRGQSIGDVSESRILEQMEILEEAFAEAGVTFRLVRIHRVKRRGWYAGCGKWWIEDAMKKRLAVRPRRTLNVYTCDPGAFLGSSTFPWDYDEEPHLKGVIVDHETLPGGAAAPFNEGDTLVHETGHYLGLYHTFDGACAAPGDHVADTPAERTPGYGCPIRRNSCPGPDKDPVDNFMDYSDDACMNTFSLGQGRRVRDLATLRR